MPERMTIADSDVRLILDIVDQSRAGERGRYIPHSMLRDLAALVPYDEATFQVMNLQEQTVSLQEHDDPDGQPPDGGWEYWWPAFWECCAYPQRTGDYVSIVRGSDRRVGTEKGPHWARFADSLDEPFPERRAIVSLPPSGSIDRRLLLWRYNGSDFTDREVGLLALLRPHLAELFELQRQAHPDRERLTSRQVQILALVGDGDTNAQIARQLGVSEGTVRKHLENAYARLGVTNRVAAVRATRELKYAG